MNEQAQIGVVGLGVMGSNLARNFASRGYRVAVTNRHYNRTEALIEEHPEAGFIPCRDMASFAESLAKPRTAIIMVKAGEATDSVINQLADVFEPGDIIVDGGNALFTDTIRRERELRERGLHFVGAGISGGEVGALKGPSIMPGGSAEAYKTLGPMLEAIAARAEDGAPCVTHIGTDGAGHFVKMVHNGIEYADMQLIAEAVTLLRGVGGLSPAECSTVLADWNRGELSSYLIEITSELLAHVDAETGKPFVDIVDDVAGMKGTGTWTVQSALTLGSPASAIAEAVFARGLSAETEVRSAVREATARCSEDSSVEREPAGESTTALAEALTPDRDALVEQVRKALYAAKIVAYAQGFDVILSGAKAYGWDIKPAELARIWRAGCIIRAKFLGDITRAFEHSPELVSLLADDHFAAQTRENLDSWRRVCALGALSGVSTPAFSSTLAAYEALTSERLSTALIQAQRDYFGSHTYHRIDKEGVFHTDWAEDGLEHRTDQ